MQVQLTQSSSSAHAVRAAVVGIADVLSWCDQLADALGRIKCAKFKADQLSLQKEAGIKGESRWTRSFRTWVLLFSVVCQLKTIREVTTSKLDTEKYLMAHLKTNNLSQTQQLSLNYHRFFCFLAIGFTFDDLVHQLDNLPVTHTSKQHYEWRNSSFPTAANVFSKGICHFKTTILNWDWTLKSFFAVKSHSLSAIQLNFQLMFPCSHRIPPCLSPLLLNCKGFRRSCS